jgi:2-hydroxychromene-2-carboxylate isomerase
MAFSAFESDAPLICYIDYKSPYAFVAKDPTYALGDRLGIQIDWRPITLDIPSYLGSARLDKQDKVVESNRSEEQWTGIKYAYRDARRYAALNGYTLRGTVKIWDTSLIHIAMMWVKTNDPERLRAFTDTVYERFWRRDLDVEDIAVVVDVLNGVDVETQGFQAYAQGSGRVMHDDMQKDIFDAGIYGVPTYIVEEEMFFGREHLPMIDWILQGRRGNPPDIAYVSLQRPWPA